ncbi:Pyranose oxidase [Trametes cinnabarina]|uniref:Pyranose oxidase n=1 Tax=Pycnoporus cinnabarinus TaxID=5643 RepID=A0A060S1Q5_PYCCI|nr:Pyranose oxidase [Trametes cinnabarina]
MAQHASNTTTFDLEHSHWKSKTAASIPLSDGKSFAGFDLPTLPLPQLPSGLEPEYDVVIAGSGPIGATYARILVEAGYKNIEYQKNIDKFVKRALSVPPRQNRHSSISSQGQLMPVSVPVNTMVADTLSPVSWQASSFFVRNGANPGQDPFRNLGGQAVTRVVGGMATHWTCATPRFHRVERPRLIQGDDAADDKEWARLYHIAESYIKTGHTQFEHSIRHNLVLDRLRASYPKSRTFHQLPLAAQRPGQNPDARYIEWSSAHTVFDLKNRPNADAPKGRFNLFPAVICERVIRDENDGARIASIQINDLVGQQRYRIKAKVFILATGAVHNPQILVNSGFSRPGRPDPKLPPPARLPYLGTHITEQTLSFCQTVLSTELVEYVKVDLTITGKPGEPGYKVTYTPDDPKNKHPNWWNEKVIKHMMAHQEDPLPIPLDDPGESRGERGAGGLADGLRSAEPQVTTPFGDSHPWHTQVRICRSQSTDRLLTSIRPDPPRRLQASPLPSFVLPVSDTASLLLCGSYGAVAESIDTRLVVDWRFFGRTQPKEENKIWYSDKLTDQYNMPQPTFDFRFPEGQTSEEAERMMTDMCVMSAKVGGFLPGSYPQYMQPGLVLHLGGTHRMGFDEKKDKACVDTDSRVFGVQNLFLGGCGNIGTAYASNRHVPPPLSLPRVCVTPTLTAMALAIKSCEYIKKTFKPSAFLPIKPTHAQHAAGQA